MAITFSKNQLKIALRGLLVVFYTAAGINHFINPAFYLPLIPPYFPFPELINTLSGVAEIVLAAGVAFPTTRRWAAIGIILMLVAFIPSHVYFIQAGACFGEQSLCTPLWVAWVRLFPIHPLLMLWAWFIR